MRNEKGQFVKGHKIALIWSAQRRKKQSENMKKRRANPDIKKKYSQMWLGKNNPQYGKKPNENQLKGLLIGRGLKGEKSPSWQGGLTPINQGIRNSKEFKDWRKKVFERDNFYCQECGDTKCYLEAHHIKAFAKFPEERFELENGITMCKDCHNHIEQKIRLHGA